MLDFFDELQKNSSIKSFTENEYRSLVIIPINGPNFVPLSQISEKEKIDLIKTGFQLQAEGKIFLKKYYKSTQEYSLFQSKGYSSKYETIRKITLFKQFKF